MFDKITWPQQPLIGFDTETTGINPRKDRLVTCSLVRVSAEGVERSYWLADPGVEIPEQASRIHGITTADARENGRPVEEVLAEISQVLYQHMSAGLPVVAFNATYDLTLLEAELQRHRLPTLAERLGGRIFPVVDPYLIDRTVDRYRKGKRRLEDLCRFYGIFADDDFHNAEADVLATLRLLGAILRAHPTLATTPLSELYEQQAQTHREFMEFLKSRADSSHHSFDGSVRWPIA